jgi:hypothetical protein
MRFPNLRYGDPTEFAYYAMGRTHAELARMLRRDERTIRDWLSGRAKVPWWVPEIMQRLGDLTTCDDRLIYRCYNVFNKVALLALERAALPSTIKMFGSHFHSPRTAATIVFRKEHRTQEQEIAPNTNQGNTSSHQRPPRTSSAEAVACPRLADSRCSTAHVPSPPCALAAKRPGPPVVTGYVAVPRSRSALVMTETELRLIASAAIIGDSSRPVNGYSRPAARGMPRAL